MRQIAVIDAETDPFKIGRIPKPFIWGFYDGEQYLEFFDTAGLVDYLRDKPLIVYAHNGGKFDYHFMLGEIDLFDDIMIINGRLAKFMIGACEFRDSYNILPVPLAKMQKDEIDYAIFEEEERNKPENMAAIRKYLKSDCVYLHEYVSAFVDSYGMNLTQASAAMKYWQKLTKRDAPKSTPEYFDFFSSWYFGGRVECFKTGIIDGEFNVYDINSAYPYAMLREHPIGLDYTQYEGLPPDYHLLTLNEIGPMFFRVRGVCKGAFPFRNTDNSLFFPRDDVEREYHVTGWELRAAQDTGALIPGGYEILESFVFTELIDFADYINHFYDKRQAAKEREDAKEDLFCKLFMNALYGKFGSNPRNYGKYMVVPHDAIPGLTKLGYEYGGEFGPLSLAQRELDDYEMRFYNVATAASITGFTRAYLFRALHSSGFDAVYYCDTDSITTARQGSSMVTGKKLGMWKDEGQYVRAGIGGKKLYIYESEAGETKTASKGARLSDSQLWTIAAGGVIEYAYEAPTFSVSRAPSFTKRKITATNRKNI